MEGYHAATWRACFCAHVLLQLPRFSFETEGTKQALAIVFCKAAFSRSLDIRSKPVALRKPFLLVIASRYICCPGYIKKVLEKDEDEGLTVWVCGVRSGIYFCSFVPAWSFIRLRDKVGW
ncbi:hypothetical protein AMTRI_Chr03g43350 [Amborella trichopoda]|uniref:Uncharacterized protein n=1 Tax=Amborella trichopoda TaxID=13333 RepID=W1PMZ9_AMBTC|nr:hypothetical protein AMTR_s00022p00003400 [Amborella trichopoda]